MIVKKKKNRKYMHQRKAFFYKDQDQDFIFDIDQKKDNKSLQSQNIDILPKLILEIALQITLRQ